MLTEMKERWMAYVNNGVTSEEIGPYILDSLERCSGMKVNHFAGMEQLSMGRCLKKHF